MTDLTQNAPILGSPAFIPDGQRFLHNQRLGKIVGLNESLIDKRFLYYLFNSSGVRGRIKGTATGATVKHTAPERIYSIQVDLPPVRLQRRIASILSAYDDLIENNTRRIKTLEEMVQTLYREWFVHLRFPDHESIPLVPSSLGLIPDGWAVTDLESVCVENHGIQTGPFGSQLHKSDYSTQGVPVIMPKDLIDFRICIDSISRIPEGVAEDLSRHRMRPGDIVYGRRGDIGRRAYIMPHQAGWFCGTGCLRIRPEPSTVNGWYLFNYLGRDDISSLIAGRAHGATMPNLNTRLMASVPIAVPPSELQERFAFLTFPIARWRETLIAQIENLLRTRDLLLPKLISGEVEIDNLTSEKEISKTCQR